MTLDTFQLGEPVEHRGIVVAPLFPRRDPVAAYVTLDEALPRGLRITETSTTRARCPSSSSRTRLDERVLLYDGEELVGAKQNRILNVSVLVGASAKLPIPVSCVEQGRWSRRSDAFGSATHISHSHLRRRKAETLAAQPLARGARAGRRLGRGARRSRRAWASTRRPRRTATRSRRTPARLQRARGRVPAHARPVRRRARARRRPLPRRRLPARRVRAPLAEAPRRLPARRARAARRARDVRRADLRLRRSRSATPSATRGPSAGLGEDVRLRGAGVIGSGLELDGETIQLSAFTSDDGGARAFGRIARPSARR